MTTTDVTPIRVKFRRRLVGGRTQLVLCVGGVEIQAFFVYKRKFGFAVHVKNGWVPTADKGYILNFTSELEAKRRCVAEYSKYMESLSESADG